jgi:hypothetical protein
VPSENESASETASAGHVFTDDALPRLVFNEPRVLVWLVFDALCCADGWGFLTSLARTYGDTKVLATGVDLHSPTVVGIDVGAAEDEYGRICDDEFLGANVVRWWGNSGRWGVHGSRGFEVAVAGQRDARAWPRIDNCSLLSIDAALRIAKPDSKTAGRLLASYDAFSWDPASEAGDVQTPVLQLCNEMIAGRGDPIVAIRSLVDMLELLPKEVRRIDATARIHQAWSRTQYLLLGDAREEFGSLLLEQNDRNHQRHADEERALVHEACVDIKRALEQFAASR